MSLDKAAIRAMHEIKDIADFAPGNEDTARDITARELCLDATLVEVLAIAEEFLARDDVKTILESEDDGG